MKFLFDIAGKMVFLVVAIVICLFIEWVDVVALLVVGGVGWGLLPFVNK